MGREVKEGGEVREWRGLEREDGVQREGRGEKGRKR